MLLGAVRLPSIEKTPAREVFAVQARVDLQHSQERTLARRAAGLVPVLLNTGVDPLRAKGLLPARSAPTFVKVVSVLGSIHKGTDLHGNFLGRWIGSRSWNRIAVHARLQHGI